MGSTRGSGFSEAWERTEGWLFRDGLPGTGLWMKWLWEFDSNRDICPLHTRRRATMTELSPGAWGSEMPSDLRRVSLL